MARNRAVKLSLGQVARLSLLSASLIILILFNVSQANPQVSSSANSTGGEDPRLDGTSRMPANASETFDKIAKPRRSSIRSEDLAQPGEFPFHVGVYEDTNYRCGGVLIDDYRILTTKECSQFDLIKMRVTLGDLDMSRDDGERTLKLRRVEKHPNINLAILFIKPLVLDKLPQAGLGSIKPIALPKGPQRVGDILTMTGWGTDTIEGFLSDVLKRMFFSIGSCRKQEHATFCSRQSPKGPCIGDVGGPAFKFIKGVGFQLVGTFAKASCRDECNNPNCDNIYIDIWQHLEWINNTT